MDTKTRKALTAAVEQYCARHGNELTDTAFDELLLRYRYIDDIPGLGAKARFSHTQMRHKARAAVRRELRTKGLDLVRVAVNRGGAVVFGVADATTSAVRRLNKAPNDALRIWTKRIGFMAKTWRSGWSEMAKGLPTTQRDAFLRRIEERVVATAEEELRDLDFLYSSIGQSNWAEEVRALMKDHTPHERPQRRQLALVKPGKPTRRRLP